MEGAAKELAGAISEVARQNPMAAVGGMLLKPSLGGLRKKFDPDTTGGAILLGLRAVTIVGHGSSGPDGVANAVRMAARSVKVDAVGRTAALLREGGAGRAALADEPAAPPSPATDAPADGAAA
jgi:phosphate acyltransferase